MEGADGLKISRSFTPEADITVTGLDQLIRSDRTIAPNIHLLDFDCTKMMDAPVRALKTAETNGIEDYVHSRRARKRRMKAGKIDDPILPSSDILRAERDVIASGFQPCGPDHVEPSGDEPLVELPEVFQDVFMMLDERITHDYKLPKARPCIVRSDNEFSTVDETLTGTAAIPPTAKYYSDFLGNIGLIKRMALLKVTQDDRSEDFQRHSPEIDAEVSASDTIEGAHLPAERLNLVRPVDGSLDESPMKSVELSIHDQTQRNHDHELWEAVRKRNEKRQRHHRLGTDIDRQGNEGQGAESASRVISDGCLAANEGTVKDTGLIERTPGLRENVMGPSEGMSEDRGRKGIPRRYRKKPVRFCDTEHSMGKDASHGDHSQTKRISGSKTLCHSNSELA